MAERVKENSRKRGSTKISSKHQVTLPVDALEKAGLRPGDRLRAVASGPGKVTLERENDPVAVHAGKLTGVFGPKYLSKLRAEWR